MYQTVYRIPGIMLTSSGRTSNKEWTILYFIIDSVYKKIFIEFQEGVTSKETIKSKVRVEAYANTSEVKLKSFRADNVIYKSIEFHTNIGERNQTVTFCAVGPHLKNGIAKRNTKIIIYFTRTDFLYEHSCWPKKITFHLWPLAVKHTVDNWKVLNKY